MNKDKKTILIDGVEVEVFDTMEELWEHIRKEEEELNNIVEDKKKNNLH